MPYYRNKKYIYIHFSYFLLCLLYLSIIFSRIYFVPCMQHIWAGNMTVIVLTKLYFCQLGKTLFIMNCMHIIDVIYAHIVHWIYSTKIKC